MGGLKKVCSPKGNRNEKLTRRERNVINQSERVLSALKRGVYSEKGIRSATRISPGRIHGILEEAKAWIAVTEAIFDFATREGLDDKFIEEVTFRVNGGLSLEETAKLLNTSYEKVYGCVDRLTRQNVVQGVYVERREDIDKLVNQDNPLSMGKIGKRVRLSRERVRQYLVGTGQHKTYRTKRDGSTPAEKKEEKERGQNLSYLVGQFDTLVSKKVSELPELERKAYEKAFELEKKLKKNPRSPSFLNFVELFRRYYTAEENGERESFAEIGRGLVKYPEQSIRRFCKKVGLKSLCYTRTPEDIINRKKLYQKKNSPE